jgi:hypothetical protein
LIDIDPNTGLISFTPSSGDIGEYYITIKVNDNHPTDPRTDEDVLIIRINNIPNPPEINFIGTQYATADEIYSFTVTATDPDSELLLFSDDTHLFDIERRSGKIMFIPSEVDAGYSYNITITVSDGLLNDSVTFMLLINSTSQNIQDDNNIEEDDEVLAGSVAGIPVIYLIIIILAIIIIAVISGYLIYQNKAEKDAWDRFRHPEEESTIGAEEDEADYEEVKPVPREQKSKKKVLKKVKKRR